MVDTIDSKWLLLLYHWSTLYICNRACLGAYNHYIFCKAARMCQVPPCSSSAASSASVAVSSAAAATSTLLGESLQGQGKKRPPGRQAGPGRPSAKKQIAAMDVNKSRKIHDFFQQHAFSEFNRGVSRHAQALGAIYGSSVPMPNAKAEDKEVSVAVGISHPKPEPARCQNGFTPIWFALGLGPGLGFWEGEFEFSFINVRAMLCQVLFPIPASSWSMTEPFDPYFWVKTTFDRVDCSKVKALGPWGL